MPRERRCAPASEVGAALRRGGKQEMWSVDPGLCPKQAGRWASEQRKQGWESVAQAGER